MRECKSKRDSTLILALNPISQGVGALYQIDCFYSPSFIIMLVDSFYFNVMITFFI